MKKNSDNISDEIRGGKTKDRNPENGRKDAKPKKKEGGGCLKGILTCVVSLIIIVVVLAGGGLLIGNGYLKQNYGFGIGDAIAILRGLKTDGADIIEQTPDANKQAVTDMCNGLSGALMLKDGTFTSEDVSAIVSSATESTGGSETEAATSAIIREGIEIDGADGTGETGAAGDGTGESTSGNTQSIGDMLLGKLKRENVDETKLAGIDGKFTDEYFGSTFSITITPQAISAIAYDAVSDVIASSFEGAEGAGAILKGAIVEQVFVKVPDGATDPRVTITVSVPIRANAVSAMNQAGLPGILISVAQTFLPEKMYLTCYVDVIIDDATDGRTYDFSTDVVLNAMNADQRQSTYKVIGGIVKMTSGETTDPKEYLNNIVKEYISGPIKKADETLDVKATFSTGYKLEVFKIIAEQAFKDKGYTAEDVAALYTGLLDGNIADMRANNASGVFADEEGNATASRNAFMDEFCEKYLVAKTFWKGSDGKVYINPLEEDKAVLTQVTLGFDDFLALTGMKGVAGTNVDGVEIQSLVDTSKLGGTIEVGGNTVRFLDADLADLRLSLNEKMLGALIESKVTGSLTGDLTKYDLRLEFVRLPEAGTLELGFSAKKDVITENAKELADLIDGDRIGIVVVMPVGAIAEADITQEMKDRIQLYYSSVDPDHSPNRANRISIILKDYLSAGSLEAVQKDVCAALKEAETKLGEGSLALGNAKASMASLFEVLAKETFDGKTNQLTAAELKGVVSDLYAPLAVTAEGTESFVSDGDGSGVYTGIYGKETEPYVYANFVPSTITDVRNRDNMTVKAKRFDEKWDAIGGTSGLASQGLATIVGYYNDHDGDDGYAYITFEYDIHARLEANGSDQTFGAKKIYATFMINKADTLTEAGETYYVTRLVINDTEGYDNLKILIDALKDEGEEDIDFVKLEKEVGALMHRYYNGAEMAAFRNYVETGAVA